MPTNHGRRTKRGVMVVLAVANGTIASWMIQAPKAGQACVPRTDAYFSYGRYVERQYVSCDGIADRVYSNTTGCPSDIRFADCWREQVAISRQNINWGISQVQQRLPRWGNPAQAEPIAINATDTNPPTANYDSRPVPVAPVAPAPYYRQTLPMDFAPAEVERYHPLGRLPVQQAYRPVAPVVPTYSVVPASRMAQCRYDQRFCQ